MSKFGDFWAKLMSGPDNQTPALGHYVILASASVFLVYLPIVVTRSIESNPTTQNSDVWKGLLLTFAAYVPAILGGIAAHQFWTTKTEPLPHDQDTQNGQ